MFDLSILNDSVFHDRRLVKQKKRGIGPISLFLKTRLVDYHNITRSNRNPLNFDHGLSDLEEPFVAKTDAFKYPPKYSSLLFYCSTIVDWANRDSVSVGPFTSCSMQGVCMRDLSVRLGQPYLFLHQGNCEHLLVFSDLR